MVTTTDSEASGITALSPELVTSIVDFVYPPSLVDLACSCKFLAECSRDALRNHREAHAKYRVCTDILPTTLPDLLRKALVDPVTAWHVRELEYCYSRNDWAHWKTFEFEIEESSNRRGKPPPPDYAFTQDERVQLLDRLREDFHFEESDIDKARDDLEAGSDAPLKLLVLALCPGVWSLKLSRHIWLRGRNAFGDLNPRHIQRSSLDYIQHAILQCLRHSDSAWPVGLSSLRDIAVGVETGTEIDELRPESAPHLCADIMKLPNIKSIYFDGLTQDIQQMIDDDDENGANMPYSVDERSSSLQTIFLHRANGISHKCKEVMIKGCRQLKSLTIANSEMDDIDMVVQDATEFHEESLKTLMFYETDRLHGYRCFMFKPDTWHNMCNLQVLYIPATDVMLQAFYDYEGKVECGQDHQWIADREYFADYFANRVFPSSMEVLVLGAERHERTLDADVDFLDEAIAAMIETAREPEDDGEGSNDEESNDTNSSGPRFDHRYENLKTVFLCDLDEVQVETRHNETPQPPRKKRWFSRAIAAGRKAGIDVHTRTTRGKPFHDIEFPTPPSITDLKSAPELPERPLVFNVYSGKWEPERCGNCGKCSPCLDQYDECVWREVEEEMAQLGA